MKKAVFSFLCIAAVCSSAFAWEQVAQGMYMSNMNVTNNGMRVSYRFTKESPELSKMFNLLNMTGNITHDNSIADLYAMEADFEVNCSARTYRAYNFKYYDSSNNLLFNLYEGKTDSIDNNPQVRMFCDQLSQNRQMY